MMKKYILTIKYDDNKEDMEFLSEEILEIIDPNDLGNIELDEYYDKDILEFMDECYIIGKA